MISGIRSEFVTVGDLYSFTPTSSDLDGNVLTFSVNNLPAWLRINSNTGTLTGIPNTGDTGNYSNIDLIVSDSKASSALPSFSISVQAMVTDNDIDSDGIINRLDNCTLIANADQRDTNNDGYGNVCDGDLQSDGITNWDDVNRSYWYFGVLGESSYNPDADINGDNIVNDIDANLIHARILSPGVPGPSGIAGNTGQNQAPTIDGTPNNHILISEFYEFTPKAEDGDGDGLQFFIENQPEWTVFNTATGSLSGTPQFLDVGRYNDILISVMDGQTSSALPIFSIDVTTDPTDTDCTSTSIHCVDDTPGEAQEFSTIQAAVDMALPGDLVRIYGGTYVGFEVNSSGTEDSPIVVKAAENGTIVSGGVTYNGESYGILLNDVSYVTIDGITIEGALFNPHMGIAARGATATAPMQGLVIRNNRVSHAEQSNIYLSQVSHSLVNGNSASNSLESHGIYLANGGADNTSLIGNTVVNNASMGIHLNGDLSIGGDGLQSELIIRGNIIYSNTNGLSMDGVQNTIISNNLIYGNIRHALRAFRIDGGQGPKSLVLINNTLVSENGWPIKVSEDNGDHTLFNNILINRGDYGSISVENADLTTGFNIVNDAFSLNGTTYDFIGWRSIGQGASSIVSPGMDTLFK